MDGQVCPNEIRANAGEIKRPVQHKIKDTASACGVSMGATDRLLAS